MFTVKSTANIYSPLNAVCVNFIDEQRIDEEQQQIYYAVMYFIHSAPNLSRLYLSWSELKLFQKCILNSQVRLCLQKVGQRIYLPVIRAFQYWDMVQDTFGAPGFSGSPVKYLLNEEIDRNMVKTMRIVESVIHNIYLKQKAMLELVAYKEPHSILHSYKWSIVCKNLAKKRSYLTHKRKEPIVNKEVTEENHSTDLNASGDTTWFSDFE